MKTTLHFGKINFYGSRRDNEVTIENGERVYTGNKTPVYTEFTAVGKIWNRFHTDIICGGQCLEEIKKHRAQLKDKALFDEVYRLWKAYHLNGMHAGTPEQEAAVKEYTNTGNKYEYTAVCNYLKCRGLYEINFTGKSCGRYYNNELYRYGTAWIIEDIPGDDLLRIEHIITANEH